MGRKRERDRGIALVLVLTVVMALVIIATPFVLSMTTQEQTATTERAQQQAFVGAQGAARIPLEVLRRTQEHYERREPILPWNTPYADSSRTDLQPGPRYDPEFAVDLRDARLRPLKVLDPAGQIWGVTTEDEQGKINIRSVPERVLRVLRLHTGDPRVNDPKDWTTIWSARDAKWIFPQRVREVGMILLPNGNQVQGIRVDDASHFGREARVRFVRPGSSQAHETRVTQNYMLSDDFPVFDVAEQPPPGCEIVEVEARHPVNINTARRETMIAMLEGVRLEIPSATARVQEEITRDEAQHLVNAMRGRVFESWQEFAQWLGGQAVGSPYDRVATLLTLTDPTNVALAGTGSMPGCFTSGDTVAIAARGVMNSPAGTPLAQVGFRQVADLGAPGILTWTLESEFDFDRYMSDAFLALAGFGAVQAGAPMPMNGEWGWPWGHRLDTFPRIYPEISDKALKPQAVDQTALFKLAHAVDLRGRGGIWTHRYHFPDRIEGEKLDGKDWRYEWTDALAPPQQSGVPLNDAADIAAGGWEAWVRFDGVGDISLFNVRESDNINRISLEFTAGELIVNVTDASIPDPGGRAPLSKGRAQIRHAFRPDQDRWYHIGLYWKGTRWAHMVLLVDGYGDKDAKFRHVDTFGNATITELSGPMRAAAAPWPTPPPASAITLVDPNWTPDYPVTETTDAQPNFFPLLIGDEVVHFDKANRQCFQGQRGTTSREHAANVKVQMFGYSSKLRPVNLAWTLPTGNRVELQLNRLPVTLGRNLMGFGDNPQGQVFGDKSDPSGLTYVDAAQDFIPFTTPDVAQWPGTGYIVIENEAIFYTAIDVTDPAAPRFTGCVRGTQTTIAAQHNTGANITLWSIAASDQSGYLNPTIIQVGDEWFGPVQTDRERQTFWIGMVDATIPMPITRGAFWFNRPASVHAVAEDILPVFAVSESDIRVNRANVARWDYITITDQARNRSFARVRQVLRPGQEWPTMPQPVPYPWFNVTPRPTWTGPAPNEVQLVGLWAHMTTPYVPDDQYCRILKWPSGELIEVPWLNETKPQVVIGPAAVTIDEVKFYASPKGDFRTTGPADDTITSIPVNSAGSLDPSGNNVTIVKIGDEIIGVADVRGGSDAARLKRGYLNTTAAVHAHGELIFNLSLLPVTKLTAEIGPGDRFLPVAREMQGEPFHRGYALIDEEVVGFEVMETKQGTRYDCLPDFKGQGLFRGRFGTGRQTHVQDSLVYGIPHRYWDTYAPNAFDSRMAYYQAAITRRGARWNTLQWDETIVPANDQTVRTHCHVRADALGEFHDPPAQSDAVMLWEFTKPNVSNKLDYIASQREQGQLEVRFQIEYMAGSYWPNHVWKNTPRIEQVRVEYDRPPKVLFHQDD